MIYTGEASGGSWFHGLDNEGFGGHVLLVETRSIFSSRVLMSCINASRVVAALSFTSILCGTLAAQSASGPEDLSAQVEIRRTAHGVPHIRAQTLRAAAYALAWVQLEDHGPRVAMGLLRGRGEMGRWFGRDSMESDFVAKLVYGRAIQNYARLDDDTRDVYEGFAAGANRYIETHPSEFPAGFRPQFTGYDIAGRDIGFTSGNAARRFLARMDTTLQRRQQRGQQDPGEGDALLRDDPPDEGSNAWAFAPSRSKSGHAMLLRNPHLGWDAGYYEAHMTVPGVIDFYGDFRIGGPFGVIGGFNRDLGFATTNNAPDLEEIYSFDVDSELPDHYVLDGASLPLRRELVTVAYRNGNGISTETREMWGSPAGPVIHRANGKIYILRAAGDGEYRAGQQFLMMMRAKSLAEFKEAMRMRARMNSSFTYADRAGNIYYLWNAALPKLPHPNGGDTAAVHVRRTSEMWTRYVDFDSLPQMVNPRGGYVHNENSSPWYSNMQQPLQRERWGPNFPDQDLSLRSQLAIQLIDNKKKMTLEEMIALKHSTRMLLADRVKPDLVSAVRASNPSGEVAKAIELVAAWDNTASITSRGSVLFENWWRRYIQGARPDSMYANPWTPSAPMTTPNGIRDKAKAVEAFAEAVAETARRHGSYDVAWGDVHRVRIGKTDVPVGGCNGDVGCFRVLWFGNDPDGKRSVRGGDGWILAVEFAPVPRAYSVLAYGQSPKPDSPYHGDQAEMFARGELKRVAFTEADIEAGTIRRYRPGAP